VNFSTQEHDFNPGINPYPDGLFWTVAMPADSLTVQFGAGKATMKGSNIAVGDYGNILNGLFHGVPPVPSHCSFDIEWSPPVTDRYQLDDPVVGFAGEFVLSQANMTWSASRDDGFRFVSNPGKKSVFAQLGHMRNGVFFEGG